MGVGKARGLMLGAAGEQGGEGSEGDFEVGDELERAGLLILADARRTRAALPLIACRKKRLARPSKTLPHIDVAKGAALERPCRAPHRKGAAAEDSERMLQKRHQSGRGEIALDSAEHEIEELCERITSAREKKSILDLEP